MAKASNGVEVWLSDYPDENILHRLNQNVMRNDLESRCRVVGHIWGSRDVVASPWNVSPGNNLNYRAPFELAPSFDALTGIFDIVVAADTLWNRDSHLALLDSIMHLLKPSSESRAIIVAGLHTGRYTLQRFISLADETGFVFTAIREQRVHGTDERPWDVEREGEDDSARRDWVVCMELRLMGWCG